MSERRSSEELVAELAGALAPVRPIAPFRAQMLAVAGAWAVSAALFYFLGGARPVEVFARGGASTAIFTALALLGPAGIAFGLATRIPGREGVVRTAAAALAGGAAVLAALGIALSATPREAGLFAASQPCMDRSFLLAIPPAALAALLALRAAPWHARTSALGIAVGASALGALLVHVTCPWPNAWHGLLAHGVVPGLGGLAIGLAAGWLVTRRTGARGTRREAR